MRHLVDQPGVVLPDAAADDRPVVHAVRKAEARLDVVGVERPIRLEERLDSQLVGERVGLDVWTRLI
ncbi:MAG: hypothetical protein A3F70_03240 [Acidobacteria bacterium RIFCSPLOWO2_12_FULL_67_14]|nr:MAG: hypothetical protein A3H29_17975 [Acidobacteria bacterium RIFCSPLOWO2_02_FULL_67_21]OFW37935.1 MAG: hypothetical protein A3F70_03240 [Acidobacteria bacterium RIFCSPLOWO2_12_FULL_67_14]